MSVRLDNATIDIFKVGEQDTIIIRGVIDPESLRLIQVAPYQREILPGAKVKMLMNALRTSTVPDVELGMRGEKYQVREVDRHDAFYLQNDVFVIDGLQRISAAKKLIDLDPTAKPRIGAVVHLSTTEEWEAERFRILNQDRTRLNVNVLIRNLRTQSPAIDMVYKLVQDETFVLCNRVQWSQRMSRTEILSAATLCQTVGFLHSRFGGGGRQNSNPQEMGAGLSRLMEIVGRTTMRDNVKTFFEILDECYGVKRIVFHQSAPYIRRTFLVTLADLFTRHTNFWRGQRLFVERDLRTKISKFPMTDPEIMRLCSSSGTAGSILYQLLLQHVNSGKRTRKLQPVDGLVPKNGTEEDDDPQ